MVLLHGVGSSHRYLIPLQYELASASVVHSFDLPGFGGTAKPTRPLSIAEYGRLIGRALDRLAELESRDAPRSIDVPDARHKRASPVGEGVTPVEPSGAACAVVVAHSMGTQFAVELARHRPELVSGLVLMGPVSDPRRASLARSGFELLRDTLAEPVQVKRVQGGDFLRCGLAWFVAESRVMLAYPLLERMAGLGCPVLVLRGKHDPIARADWCGRVAASARADSARSASAVVEVEGQRHVVHLTAPGRVAGAIRAFVADLLPGETLPESDEADGRDGRDWRDEHDQQDEHDERAT
ncbi:alpha/beta hydrolase [Subtercola sp. RTI3]|uniref:alpha/beta fold hydrolase n=1 Tax=Subtercola sp. RTI3 TaxID=3048639 RepID=UPI002B2381A6|nr:alpha/beta hydrolase [Subtercola sp. RTI3]